MELQCMLEYKENISASKWEQIIRKSEGTYFCHTPMWADILEKTYGYKTATRLYEIDGKEILVPMMNVKRHGLNSYVSMPMGYGGVFSESEMSSDIIELIFDDLKQSIGINSLGCSILFNPYFDMKIRTKPGVFSVENDLNYTHILPLDDDFENICANKFTKSCRSKIRKAERIGFEVECKLISKSDIESYYQIYMDSVRNRWNEKNYNPFRLYESFLKYKRNICVVIVRHHDTIVSVAIRMMYGTNVIGFGLVALDEYMKYAPNNLSQKSMIEYACENGYKNFDFGRSGELVGVRKFKESFGPKRVDLRKYVILTQLGRLGNIMLRKY